MVSIKKACWRVTHYYKHHGAKGTVQRIVESVRRLFYFNRDVIFQIDLIDWSYEMSDMKDQYAVDSISKESDIPGKFLENVFENLPEKIIKYHFKQRFERGASLWCLREENAFIGYLWTMIGKTMRPHYLPVCAKDVHIFDVFVFPEYRGQGKNDVMMAFVMDRLKQTGVQRAYIETAEWNRSAIKAIEKMEFSKIGYAKQRYRRGKNVVTWWLDERGGTPGERVSR